MQISISSSRPAAADTIAIIVPAGFDGTLPVGSGSVLSDALTASRFEGGAGSIFESWAGVDGRTRRIVIVGLGSSSVADAERAGGALVGKLQTSGARSVSIEFAGNTPSATIAARILYGAMQRGWRIDRYRTRQQEKAKPTLETLTLVSNDAGLADEWQRLSAVAEGVALTKELVSEPANILYPESFVERAQHLADLGIKLQVLDEQEMEKLGMGALLGVAQGSVRKPRLLVMTWDGTNGAQQKPVLFVGKGVTFDTGGISLKPGPGMEDMKWDMGGAGAVIGAMKALAGRKAKAHVVGICGLVENMPDGNAQRPGDIVTSMSGQTIEVLNTDAEGRLVLCDALHWGQKAFDPEYVVDLATLTGAMIIALGHEHGGLFSNDDGLADKLLAAGQASGDKLWRFPVSDAYDKLLDSPIADMKNIGGRAAGSITAAQFLQRFILPGVKWAHLDIAGMAWSDKDGPAWGKGATGYGVRVLDQFIADNFEK